MSEVRDTTAEMRISSESIRMSQRSARIARFDQNTTKWYSTLLAIISKTSFLLVRLLQHISKTRLTSGKTSLELNLEEGLKQLEVCITRSAQLVNNRVQVSSSSDEPFRGHGTQSSLRLFCRHGHVDSLEVWSWTLTFGCQSQHRKGHSSLMQMST